MIKHDEARKKLLVVTNYLAKLFEECPEEIGVLEDYITQSEVTDKDIKEFIELYLKDVRGLNIDRNRFCELRFKLSKVGEDK